MRNQGDNTMRKQIFEEASFNERFALLSFIEAIAIRDTLALQEAWHHKKQAYEFRIPKCLLTDDTGGTGDFRFDEETIELIEKHFHLK